jgi:hypothetical protein
MAKISTYPIISIPTLNDLLIGTDVENLNETKNFSLGDISGLIGQGFVPYVGATENVNLGLFSIEASSFIVDGGLASEFVKADGSLDSTVYVPETRTLTINGETYNLSADRSWDINSIDSLTTIGTSGAATYIGKVLNIPVYQPQGNYITQLSGEATGSGPGNASVTLDNTAVISKVLTGLNVTGGTVVDTDTILQAFGKVQNQINGLAGGVEYQGVWNAATNTPFLQSSVGVQGYYYVVNVAGNTNLNGITDWQVGDWAIFNGSTWDKVDNTDAVISVNGYVGAVVLTASDVGAVPTTRTLTINGVGYDLSLDRAWTVGDVRTDQSYINPSWIVSLDWGKITSTPTTLAGYGITDGALNTTTLTINGTTYDLTENRTWSVGTVTSIATTGPITGGTITGSGTIGITQAGASSDGYLSSSDWNAFNNKQEVISVTAPLTFAAGVVGITQSGAATDGYLSSTDWNTFNSKVGGSGTANTLPMWGSSSSLVNSPLSYAADTFNFQYNSATGGAVVFTNSNGAAYAYTIQMNNFGSPRSTVHGYTDGLVIQFIGGTQVSRMFANGNMILGTGTVDNGYKLEITGDLYVNTIVNAITDTDKFLVSDGGVIKYRTGAEVLSDIGAQGALTLTTTGTTGAATLIGDVLNIPNYSTDLSGYVTLGTDQTITGLKTILRGGDVLNFKIGTDTLYGLKVAYNQNELVPSGEATWSFVNTFNNGSGTGLETTPISFFRGVLVTGQRLLSASINTNLLDYYSNNPSGRYPIYAYNTGVQQFASSIIVGETTGVVNAVTGAIADLPAGVVANFKGRVIGSNAVNNDEFVTLGQVTSTSRAAISLTTTGTSGPATYSSVTGVLNIPEYQGGVTSFNTRTGAVTLTSSDVTTALGFNPVTDARTLTINGVTYDLTANRSWTVGTNPSAREIQTYIATSGQTVFTVTGGYTVGLVDVYINGVRLTSSDFTATNGTTVVLTVGTMVGNIVDIIKYTSGLVTGISGTGTTNELAYFTGSTVIASLSTATYPSLTELSYVKGVTSSIQTQLNGKQNALTNPVTGTGAAGRVAYFTGSTSISGEDALFWDSTNNRLGLGTTIPTNPLHIVSNEVSQLNIQALSGNTNSQINFEPTGTGIALIGPANNVAFAFRTNATERMRITNGGNLLVGSTTDNGAKLQVSGTATISGNLTANITTITNGTRSWVINPGSAYIQHQVGGVVEGQIDPSNGGNSWLGATSGTTGAGAKHYFSSTGAATFASSVTAGGGSLFNANSGTLSADILTVRGGGSSGAFGFRVESNNGDDLLFVNALSYNVIMGTTGGNVGIGTNNPSVKLNIIETDETTAIQINDASTAQKLMISNTSITMGRSSGSNANFKIGTINQTWGANGGNLLLQTNATERMRITSTGNVGIGTDSPVKTLDVRGTLAISNSASSFWYMDRDDSDGRFKIVDDANNDRFNITTSGNVGIGTTSPTRKLDITSTSEQLRLSYDTSGSVFTDFRSDSAGGLLINTSGGYIIQYIAGSPIMRMNANGNVLIGTTTDGGRKLEVQTGSTNAALWVQTGGTTSAYTIADFRTGTNLPALQILGNGVSYFGGNVGIGTASPTAKLDVSGSTSITGNLDLLAGGVGSGFNRQISIGSGTAYNYQIKADGDDFNIIEAGSTSRLRYDYGDVRWYITGGLTISGSLSKGSGSFKIDHPLPEKKDTHHLVHSFVEAPQADNIYRGKIDLVDGFGEVNIDEASGMSEGTFVLLNGNIQCFTSNEKGWTAIRGKVEGNILKIEAQDLKCNDTISWLVIGERIDQHMIDTDWTDENGKVIVEPLKKINT